MTTAPYTVGTGVPGPGSFSGGTVGLDLTLTGDNKPTYETYGCKVPNVDPINTPDWERATVYFERKVFTDGLMKMPDGKTVPFWGFEDTIKGKDKKLFPSPLIRLQQGQLAHVKMETRKGAHTIHHHGIEPTTMNDGVGHVSFETSGNYVYQWQPRHAGTWFYHCHVNTVLHFEMGLYGLLIVDPPEGWGIPYAGGIKHKYDVETSWVFDDMDPRWHTLNQAAGLCGEDVGLNIFKPKYFLVNGVSKPVNGKFAAPVAITARQGQKVLIRLLNASYSVLGVRLKTLDSEIISVDGHALASPERPWSSVKPVAKDTEILLNSAMRHDMWLDLTGVPKGEHKIEFRYYDWITKDVHNKGQGVYEGYAETTLNVT